LRTEVSLGIKQDRDQLWALVNTVMWLTKRLTFENSLHGTYELTFTGNSWSLSINNPLPHHPPACPRTRFKTLFLATLRGLLGAAEEKGRRREKEKEGVRTEGIKYK
jgi:hypothetical protein